MDDDPRSIADAEVRANGGEVIHRGPLRIDDPHWPAEAARLQRGLRIRDVSDPDPKGWVALVFPDGSVRLCAAVARQAWFEAAPSVPSAGPGQPTPASASSEGGAAGVSQP